MSTTCTHIDSITITELPEEIPGCEARSAEPGGCVDDVAFVGSAPS
jgi:hypothetical protein